VDLKVGVRSRTDGHADVSDEPPCALADNILQLRQAVMQTKCALRRIADSEQLTGAAPVRRAPFV